MTHTVIGCEDCPFFNAYYGGETISGKADTGDDCCNHPKAPTNKEGKMLDIESDKYFNKITPDWCPLKIEPITIQIEVK